MSALDTESFGPTTVSTAPERVGAFVAATGDDPERWLNVAPPSFAAVTLIAVAGDLLRSAIEEFGAVVHTRQRFEWSEPIIVGTDSSVSGRVESVRERSGATFVEFAATAAGVTSVSQFLMASEAAALDPVEEPGPVERSKTELPRAQSAAVAVDQSIAPLHKSASRLDILKYAAASDDWNPIHWDHASAVDAGLGGVIAHGLLVASWASQAASRYSARSDPLASLDVRFRSPLRPAAAVRVDGVVSAVAPLRLELSIGTADQQLATAKAEVNA